MKIITQLILIALVCAVTTPNSLFALQEQDADVQLVFRNTTDSPVTFNFVDDSDDDDTKIEFIAIHKDNPLKPGDEREYESMSGVTWEVTQSGKTIAMYVGDARPRQIVDIKELASWQRPVKINFQNSSNAPVDIFYTDEEGVQTLIVDELPAGSELNEMLVSLPNQLWTIEQDGKFFADYFPDNEPQQVVDLAVLKTWYEPVEVTFKNMTTKPLHVYFVNDDDKHILYTKTSEGRFDPIEEGQSVVQACNPFHKWVIKSNGKAIAEYLATNEKKQTVEITNDLLTE